MIIIQNDPRVPAGLFAAHLGEKGIPHRTVHLHAGEILPRPDDCRAVAVLGGYMGVHDTDRHPFLLPLMNFMRECAERDVPLLGICLGGQLLAAALGGEVQGQSRGEKGVREIVLTAAGSEDPLFAGLPRALPVFQWHNDSFDSPPASVHLAFSPCCPGQAFRFRRAWGVQFHPEVDETIVSAWVQSAGADPDHLRAFAAARDPLARVGSALFGNFLRLAGFLP